MSSCEDAELGASWLLVALGVLGGVGGRTAGRLTLGVRDLEGLQGGTGATEEHQVGQGVLGSSGPPEST